eukprot:1371673-Rhodomonas_salina.2
MLRLYASIEPILQCHPDSEQDVVQAHTLHAATQHTVAAYSASTPSSIQCRPTLACLYLLSPLPLFPLCPSVPPSFPQSSPPRFAQRWEPGRGRGIERGERERKGGGTRREGDRVQRTKRGERGRMGEGKEHGKKKHICQRERAGMREGRK